MPEGSLRKWLDLLLRRYCFGSYSDSVWSLRKCRFGLLVGHEDRYLSHMAALECSTPNDHHDMTSLEDSELETTMGVEVMGLIFSSLQLLDVGLINVHCIL